MDPNQNLLQSKSTKPTLKAIQSAPTTVASASTQLSIELQTLARKVAQTQLPKELRDKANGAIFRLQTMAQTDSYSAEYETISEYINWITSIPWGKYTADNLDLTHAGESLNKNHYGLDNVKNRILEYLATIHLTLKIQKETFEK
jgi:ATP-dependent Lon protease